MDSKVEAARAKPTEAGSLHHAAAAAPIKSLFAYGAWIWKPEFRYKDLAIGVALGFSRQLYQGSQEDYGTPSWPGRIATIMPSPSNGVLGCIYRLSGRHAARDLARLEELQAARGFHRAELAVENCTSGQAEDCWVFIARQGDQNPYWLGRAEPSEIAFQVAQASGHLGDNLDYVRRLVDFVRLQTRGVIDRDLDTKKVLRLAAAAEPDGPSRQHQHQHQHHEPHQPDRRQQHRQHPEGDNRSTVFLVREEMRSQLVDGGRPAATEEEEKMKRKERLRRLDESPVEAMRRRAPAADAGDADGRDRERRRRARNFVSEEELVRPRKSKEKDGKMKPDKKLDKKAKKKEKKEEGKKKK